jgi:hypothetical protein
MKLPLFDGAMGEFMAVEYVPPANRSTILRMHEMTSSVEREAVRRRVQRESAAGYGLADSFETPHTVVFSQVLRHERLGPSRRSLELWKREARARLSVWLDRLPSRAPEVFYLVFDLPRGVPMPVVSSGGVPFVAYKEQLRGSCKDYLAIDGWAHYRTEAGEYLWVTRDAPLVSIGRPHAVERHQDPPARTERILAMVFDNQWHTNFVADSHGEVQFQFDLLWRPAIGPVADVAEALAGDPVVHVITLAPESPAERDAIHRP